MSIEKMLLREKRKEILEKCNWDIRDVKNYLISHFDLPKGYDFSREKKRFEAVLYEETETVAQNNRMKEFIKKFEVKIDDN